MDVFETFSKKRASVNHNENVAQKELKDTSENYSKLVDVSILLSRFNYIANTSKDFTFHEVVEMLGDPDHLSVSSALKIFAKANQKDRFANLLKLLMSNIDMTAQMTYLWLLRQNSSDDSAFFIFNTFPAMMNFFMFHEDYTRAISFVKKLFQLHFSLVGVNFNANHVFLKKMISSFFYGVNPGKFFEFCVTPIIPEYVNMAKDIRVKYTMIYDKITRVEYWQMLTICASKVVKRMISHVPLFPVPARELIAAILDLEKTTGFPLRFPFIIDAMICEYMENEFMTTVDHAIVKDLCSLIRCCYPQDCFPCELSANLRDVCILSTITLDELVDSLSPKPSVEQTKTVIDYKYFMCPRDIHLVIEMMHDFVALGDPEKISELIKFAEGIIRFDDKSCTKIIEFKKWGEIPLADNLSTSTQPYDDYSSMASMYSESLTPSVIASYASIFLTPVQFITIHECDVSQPALASVMDKLESSIKTVRKAQDDLLTTLFMIEEMTKGRRTQLNKEQRIFIKKMFTPKYMTGLKGIFFEEKESDEFINKETIDKLSVYVVNELTKLNLTPEVNKMAQRDVLYQFFNRMDTWYRIRDRTNLTGLTSKMLSYAKEHKDLIKAIPASKQDLVSQMTACFDLIDNYTPIWENMNYMFAGMHQLSSFSFEQAMAIIASTGNSKIFSFGFFLGGYVNSPENNELMFTETEQKDLKKFLAVIGTIDTYM